jgi:hypothetical protein
LKEKAAGGCPAAEAMILNADDRPDRESAAAARMKEGPVVDHKPGYKAAPIRGQGKLIG